jgi:hypothetical protein
VQALWRAVALGVALGIGIEGTSAGLQRVDGGEVVTAHGGILPRLRDRAVTSPRQPDDVSLMTSA